MHEHLATFLCEPRDDLMIRVDLWDTGSQRHGRTNLRYALAMISGNRAVVIDGEDFSPSPMHADDSLETARGLLSFFAYYGDCGRESSEGPDDLTDRQWDALDEWHEYLWLASHTPEPWFRYNGETGEREPAN